MNAKGFTKRLTRELDGMVKGVLLQLPWRREWVLGSSQRELFKRTKEANHLLRHAAATLQTISSAYPEVGSGAVKVMLLSPATQTGNSLMVASTHCAWCVIGAARQAGPA